MFEENKPRSVLNGLDGLLFLLSFIHVSNELYSCFPKIRFCAEALLHFGFFPNHVKNDLTPSSRRPPSLSL